MTDTKYNGWTNYETWNVKLWMDNDQGSYEYYNEIAKEYAKNCKAEYDWQTDREAAAYALSEALKSEFDDANPLGDDASCLSDLLGAALSSVNWYEIAESLLDYVEESEAA